MSSIQCRSKETGCWGGVGVWVNAAFIISSGATPQR